MQYPSEEMVSNNDVSDSQFSNDELSTFKRYLEENIASSDNNFEYLENNLSYYSARHTSESYFSPAEYYQANANCVKSDELIANVKLYKKAIEWHSTSVHPADSEYVIKKEKYVYVSELVKPLKLLVEYLNEFPKEDFFTVDLLIYKAGEIFQYLPQKDFLFKRKETKLRLDVITNVSEEIEQDEPRTKDLDFSRSAAIFPIFVPIRKMLFFGEFGYRSALIEYGRVIERLRAYFRSKNIPLRDVLIFENYKVNEMLGLDGIERSIQNVLLWKQVA